LYAKVGGLLKEKGVSRIIGIGKAISHQADKFSIQKDFFEDTASFLERFPLSSFQNETILLKGARIFEFEQISRLLQQKTHDTVLEIDLNALLHNLNYYRSLLNPGTRVMAMVKAFSYGSGSFEIANVLQFNHIDYLAVAYADEGIELRKAGIHTPILVMSPEADSLDAMITYGLEPEIYSMRILKLLIDVMAARSDQESARVLVHLKLDTGMHRLGFAPEEVDDLIQLLSQHKHIVVRSAFSHLAASEDPAEDSFTRAQIASLVKMGTRLKTEFGEGILLHILNSSGITRFPDAQLDMVRLGIGLYGIGHDEKEQQLLQNVGTLRSIITQIKAIPKGESVGYNRKWIAKRNARIAIVPVGYADGLDRRLGNGRGSVVIGASTVPIIGNVCMDMCMVDVTDIAAEEGDVVEIFGKSYTVHQFAQTLDTIPYEVLTSISARVKRVYFQE
jgi:alanine racemase